MELPYDVGGAPAGVNEPVDEGGGPAGVVVGLLEAPKEKRFDCFLFGVDGAGLEEYSMSGTLKLILWLELPLDGR